MKSSMLGTIFVLASLAPVYAFAQGQSLAAAIEVYVFPSEGQDSGRQSMDESDCYQWAVANTGGDPFDLAKQQGVDEQQAQAELQQAQQVGRGAGAAGAAGGAAAGALIGEIANDDAGEGAAWGAALGAIASRRKAKEAQAQATDAAAGRAVQRETATAEQIDNFKKAFSVCLEAKDYLVKY
ncbi:MAG TPA: hypothetical protein VF329_08035 [Gammaproteobacteria bacterium]